MVEIFLSDLRDLSGKKRFVSTILHMNIPCDAHPSCQESLYVPIVITTPAENTFNGTVMHIMWLGGWLLSIRPLQQPLPSSQCSLYPREKCLLKYKPEAVDKRLHNDFSPLHLPLPETEDLIRIYCYHLSLENSLS